MTVVLQPSGATCRAVGPILPRSSRTSKATCVRSNAKDREGGQARPGLDRIKDNPAYQRLLQGSWREQYGSSGTTQQQDLSPAAAGKPSTESTTQSPPIQQHEAEQQAVPGQEASDSSPIPSSEDSKGQSSIPSSSTSSLSISSANSLYGRPQRRAGLAQPMTRVRFWLGFHVEYGQQLRVVGSHANIGDWQLKGGLDLRWSEGDQWTAEVELPAGQILEYKYALLDSSGTISLAWQQGNNSVLALRRDDREVEVHDSWGGGPGASVVSGGQAATRESRLANWAADLESHITAQRGELRRSRMELIAAQDEARAAREEARRVKAELASVEAERTKSATRIKELESLTTLLRSQLQASSSSARDALNQAFQILSEGVQATGAAQGQQDQVQPASASDQSAHAAPPASSNGASAPSDAGSQLAR